MKSTLAIFSALLLCLSALTQVPNSGFEFWTNQRPDDWVTNSCPECDPPWESYTVRQDTDAYSGIYCANLYANGVFKPYAFTSFPVSYRPVKMKFFTKVSFAPCVNDSGYFQQDTVSATVELLHNGSVVDSGYWSYTGANISSYQLAEVPLTQSTTLFDSCRIYFEGGNIFGGCGVIAEATRFKVDEASLEFPTGCQAVIYYSKRTDTVSFSYYSDHVSVISLLWDFDDGQTDTVINPEHIYAQEGWYNACLTVEGLDTSGNICTSTTCIPILITHDCIDTSQICPPPSLCCDAPLYDPVCGCDSVTYDNACQAMLWHGVTSYTPGACWTSTNEIQPSLINLFHNPSGDQVELKMVLHELHQITVNIKNTLGATIETMHPTFARDGHHSFFIRLEKIPAGIYFFEITLDGEIVAVKKLVKR